MNVSYAEVGTRFIIHPAPPEYDNWGYNEQGEKWEHSFCVMDDYGTAVPVSPFNVQNDDYTPFWGPDYDPNTPPGQPYKYVEYQQLPH
ncbi:hypothetical protein [Ralstonia phage RP13]|nr:hypothetical protein [Ralstonia phage RP13]